ncbi:MAG: hypothetical protein ACXABY_08005 [Candidatus Thorarchaeota archaeon]|jgi:chromosome segregation ATPase
MDTDKLKELSELREQLLLEIEDYDKRLHSLNTQKDRAMSKLKECETEIMDIMSEFMFELASDVEDTEEEQEAESSAPVIPTDTDTASTKEKDDVVILGSAMESEDQQYDVTDLDSAFLEPGV